MKKVIKKIVEIKKNAYVDIIGASLLTLDQFEKARKELPHCKREWWIYAHNKNQEDVPIVVSRSDILSKDYNVTELLGVRPILHISHSGDLKLRDKFEFAGHMWKVILDDTDIIAISKDVIGVNQFNNENYMNEDGINPNDYEHSEIKEYIDSWAKDNGIYIVKINDID